jgi:uncharacterized delta-60 repeat protein
MKKNSTTKILGILLAGTLLLGAYRAWSSPGTVDCFFGAPGNHGLVKADYSSSSDMGNASAIYSSGTHQGKVVVVGSGGSTVDNFIVMRFNADGTLDTTFSGDGKTDVDFNGSYARASGVAIQSDDKIVVIGSANLKEPATPPYTTYRDDLAAIRLNADGSLDTSFSGDGKVNFAVGYASSTWSDVAIQSDGKIVIAGYSYQVSEQVSTIVRLNSDGSLDGTYYTNMSTTSNMDAFTVVRIQTDGKIVCAGWAYDGSTNRSTLVRFNSDGSLDTSFSGDGKLLYNAGSGSESVNGLEIQSDGKYLVGGHADYTDRDWVVCRIDSSGNLDATFSGDGKASIDMGGSSDEAYGLALQSDGKIIIGGFCLGPMDFDFAAARFNSDGSLDTTFSGDGKALVDFGSDDRGDAGPRIAPDGKIVLAGWSGNDGAARDFALVRLYDQSTNMLYCSTVAVQNTNPIAPGAVGAIISVELCMNGDLNGQSATNLQFNTTGTTSISDITEAKLYYTGTANSFATGTQVGSTVSFPNGTFSFTGSQALSEGKNYFWLAYTIAPGATINHVVDAQCTGITLSGEGAQTPLVTSPAVPHHHEYSGHLRYLGQSCQWRG